MVRFTMRVFQSVQMKNKQILKRLATDSSGNTYKIANRLSVTFPRTHSLVAVD